LDVALEGRDALVLGLERVLERCRLAEQVGLLLDGLRDLAELGGRARELLVQLLDLAVSIGELALRGLGALLGGGVAGGGLVQLLGLVGQVPDERRLGLRRPGKVGPDRVGGALGLLGTLARGLHLRRGLVGALGRGLGLSGGGLGALGGGL